MLIIRARDVPKIDSLTILQVLRLRFAQIRRVFEVEFFEFFIE